jgi:preprotein translocase subunit SecD
MLRFPPWKMALVLGICLLGLVYSLPNLFPRAEMERMPEWLPHKQINLGLDLQGGSHLLLEVDLSAMLTERLEALVDDVRATLRAERIGYRSLGRLSDDAAQEMQRAAVAQSLEIVNRRIDEVGTREPTIQRQGDDRILVQVPGEKDPESIKRLLGQTAKLTFHLVDLDTSVEQALSGNLPPGSELLPGDENDASGGAAQYVVRKRVEVSGENLVDAQPTYYQNQPVVSFRFDSVGGRKFGNITRDHVGELLAIVLDDKVISAPRIDEPILGGSGIIRGNFTVQEANELSVLLRAGALPAPLNIVEERSVGPDLGSDSIEAGAMAAVVAFILVAAFMVIYYGFFGLIADLALVVNLLLMFAILSVLQATLTLPGIAGIVLTIGQAIDSNVLIYERIREETRLGRTPIAAVDTGFREALRTIVDANLTALIAAVLLYAFGSGPVRGFAVTLGIGIVTTMFTAVTFTRLVMATWLWRTRPAVLPV